MDIAEKYRHKYECIKWCFRVCESPSLKSVNDYIPYLVYLYSPTIGVEDFVYPSNVFGFFWISANI